MALHVPEICFWPVKLQKTLNFLRCIHVIDLVLEYGSDVKKKKLDTASLLLLFSDGYSFLPYWIEFFVNCVSSFGSNFSLIALWRKRLQLDSQSYSAMNELIFSFFVRECLFSLTSYRYGLKFALVAQLLFFLMNRFVWCLVWGIFGLLFKIVFTFQP